MISSVRTLVPLCCENRSPMPGILSSTGMPCRVRSFSSLIRPANSTVWPLATEIELFTWRSEIVGVRLPAEAGRDVRGFLLDVDDDIAVGADPRHDAQDDAGVAIIDRADDRVVCRQHRRGSGRDRTWLAHLQCRRLIVEHDQRRVRQHPDFGHVMQRVDDYVWHRRRLSEQEIEAGKHAGQSRVPRLS